MNNLVLLLCGLLTTGCYFGDNPSKSTPLTKDFYLFWFDNKNNQELLLSQDHDPNSGTLVIEANVFAAGFDERFIIAKQRTNEVMELQDGKILKRNDRGDVRIEYMADTLNLSKEDSIYKEHGFVYKTSRKFSMKNHPGVQVADSADPKEERIYFYLIDNRKYDKSKWDSYRVYTYDSEEEFMEKRRELGVPDALDFTINTK